MSHSQHSSRASSSRRDSGQPPELRPTDSISQVAKYPYLQSWKMTERHSANSDWSLHRSDASIAKEDDFKFLPGHALAWADQTALTTQQMESLSYYPSSAKLISEVQKEDYSNDGRHLARAIGWCIYGCSPMPEEHNVYLGKQGREWALEPLTTLEGLCSFRPTHSTTGEKDSFMMLDGNLYKTLRRQLKAIGRNCLRQRKSEDETPHMKTPYYPDVTPERR